MRLQHKQPGLFFPFALLVPATFIAATAERLTATDSTAVRVQLTVTSPLGYRNVPMDPTIDFGALVQEAELAGVLDPNSIELVNVATGQPVPHVLAGDRSLKH